MGLNGINGNFGNFFTSKLGNVGSTGKTQGTAETNNINSATFQNLNSIGRTDLATNLETISNKAKINSPVAQGLASAEDIQNGKLVGDYHFDTLGDYDTKLFTLKYNTANTPQIANLTRQSSENYEYASIAGHLQAENGPFAELFT